MDASRPILTHRQGHPVGENPALCGTGGRASAAGAT